MCVGEPMRALRVIPAAHRAAPAAAECEGPRGIELIDLSLVGAIEPGDWLLVFLGAARERLTEARALEIRRALDGVAAAMRGEDPSGAFADLEAGEPRLPPHLEAARRRGDAIA